MKTVIDTISETRTHETQAEREFHRQLSEIFFEYDHLDPRDAAEVVRAAFAEAFDTEL